MLKKGFVLVVDDDDISRGILTEILANEYRVVEACNGQEAVSYIKEHAEDLDLCILDIYMPIMDGYEVIKFLRDYNYLELFPVIVITSDESSENEVRALNQGVSDFIAKPFIREIVEKRVSNVIDSSRNAKELRQMVEEQVSEIYMQQEMLQEQMRQIEEFNEKTMQGLCTIAEFRRGEYGEHV
ncbi:MAG: response regulator, partial [Lachnospiraceae bacterium]|nr:response regulator [Lachnospiraceae bacterium]